MASNKRTAAKSQGQYAEKPKGMSATRNELSIHLQPSTPCKYTIDDLNVAHAEYLPNGQLDVENSTYKDAESALRVALANVHDIDGAVEIKRGEDGNYSLKMMEEDEGYDPVYAGYLYFDENDRLATTVSMPDDWFFPNRSRAGRVPPIGEDDGRYEAKFRELQPVRDFLSGKTKELHIEESRVGTLEEDEFHREVALDWRYDERICIADECAYVFD